MSTLFDNLNVSNHHSELTLEESIRTHLQVLLNSRQGSLTHMPEYGLPDLSELYAELPESMGVFANAVANCIRCYEPRLTEVKVRPHPDANKDTVLDFIIEGKILHQRQNFVTEFRSDGWAQVKTGTA